MGGLSDFEVADEWALIAHYIIQLPWGGKSNIVLGLFIFSALISFYWV